MSASHRLGCCGALRTAVDTVGGEVFTIVDGLAERIQLVDTLERRLNALQASASDMDDKFTAMFVRHTELAQKSDEFEQKLKALADREPVVTAMKEELDNVHQMSARSKADLQHISDHGQDLSLLRSRLEELLTLTGAAEQKIRRIF